MTGFHWTTVTALLAMMAVGTSAIPDMDCPATDDEPVLYPNPEDCTTFYQCSHGRPVLHKCYPGLHYNPTTQQCDWPGSAGCQTFLKRSVPDYDCPANDNGGPLILIADPDDCTKYYVCDNGVLVSMVCPPGLHFNDRKKVCDQPENAGCQAPPPVYDHLPAFRSFECPDNDNGGNATYHPNPKNCSQFFVCDNGALTLRECPGILHFNPTLNICDFPDVAGCKLDPGTEQPPTEDHDESTVTWGYTTDWTDWTDWDSSVVLRPDSEDCGKYYAYDNGVVISFVCPRGLHFDAKLQVCDHPDTAGCKATFHRREQQKTFLQFNRRAH